jgi:hypothetical protein
VARCNLDARELGACPQVAAVAGSGGCAGERAAGGPRSAWRGRGGAGRWACGLAGASRCAFQSPLWSPMHAQRDCASRFRVLGGW